ncbi:hypothetical protein [Parvibaculum sp.]|uniref:hypothetical protein n=1 Tax=Parvibaculum sp. TaxID=2024848 RepID=UPI003C73449F
MANDEFANNAVGYALAKAEADLISDYVSRGRALQGLNGTELQTLFEHTFRTFVHSDNQRRDNEDTRAEFELRGLKPSFDNVKTDLEVLIARAKVTAQTEDARERIGISIIQDYIESLDRQQ